MILKTLRHRLEEWNGSPIERDLSAYEASLSTIRSRAGALRAAGDRELAFSWAEERRRLTTHGLEEGVEWAFALIGEQCRRTIGLWPFDVQMLAALAMQRGKIVEMATGEGKTLTAVMPAAVAALEGCGVHVLTFNDYLARRDVEWMGPVYRQLGLSVGVVQSTMSPRERRAAYRADVTYVTAKEAGFDLLRSNRATDPLDVVHRPFHWAILDEADSILIDEARVPLVLAGVAGPGSDLAATVRELVGELVDRGLYVTDEYGRSVELDEDGLELAAAALDRGDLLAPENLELLTQIHCGLHAAVLLTRDVDYIVRDGRVEVVDEFTGRVVEDRHWPDGLQAALEAKERLERRPEGQVLSSITLQQFVARYPHVAGMTATAAGSASELAATYGTPVVVVPPNRPSRRVDLPDAVYTHKAAKTEALVAEIVDVHTTGRPILVGTASVAESERLADLLRQRGLEPQVLNARDDAREAEIVAEAGALGALTISTNMAGRGTDIRLGGAAEADRRAVVELGGLYVIGTNRHESSRIDRQLRGRAGRQGDPGSSRFFISLEDDLIVRYGVRNLIPAALLPAAQAAPIDNPVIRREIARAQRIVEGQNAEIRRTLAGYSSLVEEQRRRLHATRHLVLEGLAASTLRVRCSGRWSELEEIYGEALPRDVERRITLFHLDRCWSEHLARVADLKEGIHLLRIGGEDPLAQFLRDVADSFAELEAELERSVEETFLDAEIDEHGIDLETAGLRGPSSTWTYLVNDDPFRDQLALSLGANVGLAAAAAIYTGPLLIAWGLYNRFVRSRRSRGADG